MDLCGSLAGEEVHERRESLHVVVRRSPLYNRSADPISYFSCNSSLLGCQDDDSIVPSDGCSANGFIASSYTTHESSTLATISTENYEMGG